MTELQIVLKSLTIIGVTDEQLLPGYDVHSLLEHYRDDSKFMRFIMFKDTDDGEMSIEYCIPKDSIQYVAIATVEEETDGLQ